MKRKKKNPKEKQNTYYHHQQLWQLNGKVYDNTVDCIIINLLAKGNNPSI